MRTCKHFTIYCDDSFDATKNTVRRALDPLFTHTNDFRIHFSTEDYVNLTVSICKMPYSRPSWHTFEDTLSEALCFDISLK